MAYRVISRPLGQVLDTVVDHRGRTPRKLGGDFVDAGIRVLSAKNLKEGRLDLSTDPRYVTQTMFEQWMPVKLELGDVLLTSEAPLGEVAYLGDDAHFCLGQRLFALRPNPGILHSRYLYYALRSNTIQHRLHSRATGTTAQGIRQSELLRVVLDFPEDIGQQRAIAGILGALDDKIELNRRTNETLEAIARAIFKSWFGDFDPVKRNAEGGRARDELDALFPDSFEDSELGEVPRGWRVQSFIDSIDVIGGGTPKTSVPEYWNGDIPWFSVTDTPHPGEVFVIGTEKSITEAGVSNSSTRILPTGTTIITARGTVGNLALVGVPMAMNQSCYGLRDPRSDLGYYVYFNTAAAVATLRQRTHGSVFSTITRHTLESVQVVGPPEWILAAFESSVHATLQCVLSNLHASRTLAALRDALLPKLIAGELRVPDAERIVQRFMQ